ncbi:hypothetical protein R4Q84_000358 [Pseudomonas aeruginosa]|nr:hypothetical protein [Pseudomonas aeruginosa]ELQ7317565.1 hypothetical protein [Pseudomonas aeruginosa]ELQ7329898.1 hypothetical protein [Pseudomonas aeruginosa]ELQ7337403.1 hypothetical protein [Pseudomonas aeruginosa]ELQ7342229.1 hypothetical protein [Pseudomonas aeruginosa]
MQLLRISIPAFRNLRDLDISFATHLLPGEGAPADVQPKQIRSHALIGQNGTGKSNGLRCSPAGRLRAWWESTRAWVNN